MANKRVEKSAEESKKVEIKGNTHTIRLPIDPLNPKDIYQYVGVNGKWTKVTRGEEMEVSDSVYDALRNAGLV